MRSLATKFTLAFLLIGVLGIVIFALLLGVQARTEFNRFLSSRDEASLINGLGGISVKLQDYGEVLAHPQTRTLDPTVTVREHDGREHEQIGAPFDLQDPVLPRKHAPAPRLGQHTARWLGAEGDRR